MPLTSVVIKSFEKLVLAHLKDITGPSLDPLQFAYRANRSVDDAVNMGLHYVLQHLDRPGAYVRILFVDFSLAFNTITLNLLPKLTQLPVPTSICQWITCLHLSSVYRQEVKELAVWCSLNNLELKTLKPPALSPFTIMSNTVTAVGTTISQNLKWDNHIEYRDCTSFAS